MAKSKFLKIEYLETGLGIGLFKNKKRRQLVYRPLVIKELHFGYQLIKKLIRSYTRKILFLAVCL